MLLINIGRVNHFSSSDAHTQLALLGLIYKNHHVVIALSSAEGYYVPMATAYSGIFRANIDEMTTACLDTLRDKIGNMKAKFQSVM